MISEEDAQLAAMPHATIARVVGDASATQVLRALRDDGYHLLAVGLVRWRERLGEEELDVIALKGELDGEAIDGRGTIHSALFERCVVNAERYEGWRKLQLWHEVADVIGQRMGVI